MSDDETSAANSRPSTQLGGAMDLKSVLIVAALGVGGFSGGGLLSTVNSGNVTTEIRALQASISNVERTLIEIQSTERMRDRDGVRNEERLADIEKRLRRIEDHVGPVPRGGR